MNNKQVSLVFFIISIILLVASIPYHSVIADEGWTAEHAYSMSKQGYSTSNLFKGLIETDQERVVMQHKLHVYIGAFIFKYLGFSIELFRIIPICSFIMTLILVYLYLKKQGIDDIYDYLLVTAFLISVPEFFLYAKLARPEQDIFLVEIHSKTGVNK